MKREEAKQLLPVMQAYVEGKDVQYSNKKVEKWYDAINPTFNTDVKWRIKPGPTYRPFKDAEELWAEMQKHQPFGYVKTKCGGNYTAITWIDNNRDEAMRMFEAYIFPDDGTPFGIEVEEDEK